MSCAGFRACLIYICLTVYEFSFILLIHHIILLILISVLSVTFWTLTYYKLFFFDHVLFDMKLLNYLFCDMFGSVLECYELTHISWLSTPGNHAWLNRHCYPIGCVTKSPHQGICSCSPILLSTLTSVASDLFNYSLRLDNELSARPPRGRHGLWTGLKTQMGCLQIVWWNQ